MEVSEVQPAYQPQQERIDSAFMRRIKEMETFFDKVPSMTYGSDFTVSQLNKFIHRKKKQHQPKVNSIVLTRRSKA